MKKYSKPEIKVNYFETKDVIATSCTCPTLCYHSTNINDYSYNIGDFLYTNSSSKIVYFHHNDDANIHNALYYYGYDYHNYFEGYCDEHGTYYKAEKK